MKVQQRTPIPPAATGRPVRLGMVIPGTDVEITVERAVLALVAAFVLYRLLFGGRAKERRRQIRDARSKAKEQIQKAEADYAREVSRIKGAHPRLLI